MLGKPRCHGAWTLKQLPLPLPLPLPLGCAINGANSYMSFTHTRTNYTNSVDLIIVRDT